MPITVKELIEKLKEMPQDATVLRYDYEYWHEDIEVHRVYTRGNDKVVLE